MRDNLSHPLNSLFKYIHVRQNSSCDFKPTPFPREMSRNFARCPLMVNMGRRRCTNYLWEL